MKSDLIEIGNTELPVIEYKGQRVVTFKMIDEVHNRIPGTAQKRFAENKIRYKEEKHYFKVDRAEIDTELDGINCFSKFAPTGILLTEFGYLLLVKSFTDDLAWEVQDKLIEGYFRAKNYDRFENGFGTTSVSVNSTLPPIARELTAAMKIAKCFGLTKNQAVFHSNRAVKKLTGYDCMEVLGVTHLIAEDNQIHLTPSDIGKFYGVSAQKINQHLHDLGLQVSFRDHKKRLRWKVDEKGEPYAVVKDTGKQHSDGTPILQIFWKDSVMDLLQIGAPQNINKFIQ